MHLNNGIQLTWLGHSTFKIEFDGKTILIDPWVAHNPACPEGLKTFVQLLNVPAIVPIHYGTFPILTGTPEALQELTKDLNVEIVALKPGETLA